MHNEDVQDYDDLKARIFGYFGNHLVSFAGSYIHIDRSGNDIGDEKFFAYSGFIMSVRDTWCLVTAGHCIEELENALAAKQIRLTNTRLADYFGSAPKVEDTSYFNYEEAAKLVVHDPAAGLDFALIPLREWYRTTLGGNGIRAIAEENWVSQDLSACSLFAIIGLPTCLVDDPSKVVPYGDGVAGVVNPVMVFVDPVGTPPHPIPAATFQWFVGKVLSAKHLPDIVGMSGGPIFGFRKREDGQLEYWIVAVQSRWYPASRITLGCPVRTFAGLVEHALQEHEAAGGWSGT